MSNFTKPPKSIDHLYDILIERWLDVTWEIESDIKKDLENIWYFRLSWYFKYFQHNDVFFEWINFKIILDHYIFDRKLRLLTFDAIEKIEISVKSTINTYMSLNHWIFWYLDTGLFNLTTPSSNSTYQKLLGKISKINSLKRSIFVKQYFAKYSSETSLPSWMLMEEFTIWEVSTIFNLLDYNVKKKISNSYDTYAWDFGTWLNLLQILRNISAHHARLWNRKYVAHLNTNDIKFKNFFQLDSGKVIPNYYNSVLVISYLLNKINRNFWWLNDLENLIVRYNGIIDVQKMWLNPNWKNEIEKITT